MERIIHSVLFRLLFLSVPFTSIICMSALGGFTRIERQSGKNMHQGGKPDTGKFHSSYIGMNVCGSAYESGCVVDGTCATAAD